MWDELQRILDQLIRQYGIGRVLLGPFAAIAALAGAGIITGGAVSLVATALSLFVAVVFISALYLELRATRQLLSQRARVLSLYTNRLVKSIESLAFKIDDWKEEVTVNSHGDTVLEKWVTIEVGDDELHSVWSAIHARREVSEADRRRIRVEARGFNEDGKPGARYDVTQKWVGDRIQLFIHFEQAAAAHETVRIWIRWVWPRYYKGLLEGDTEVVEWLMLRPTKRITTKMTFDKSCKLRSDFNITPRGGSPSPTQTRTPDNGLVITAEYLKVPQDVKIGFMLDRGDLRA